MSIILSMGMRKNKEIIKLNEAYIIKKYRNNLYEWLVCAKIVLIFFYIRYSLDNFHFQ